MNSILPVVHYVRFFYQPHSPVRNPDRDSLSFRQPVPNTFRNRRNPEGLIEDNLISIHKQMVIHLC